MSKSKEEVQNEIKKLEKELENIEQTEKESNVPNIKSDIDLSSVIELVEGIKKEIIDGTYYEDNDNAHYIEEEVLKAIYGEQWFDWFNENT